jgi:hypothetical protein
MRRILVVVLAALVLPAAAQAKEITGLAVCGPTACEDADVAGFGHEPPFGGDSAGPPAGRFYRLELSADGQADPFGGLYYEPVSGLVARQDRPGTFVWSRLAPQLASSVKDAAKLVRPFAAPLVTGARVGGRQVAGDASTYGALLRVDGPPALPKTSADAVGIALEATAPNPWTEVTLLYYPQDNVLFRSPGTYVALPQSDAADVEAARPLGGGDSRKIVLLVPVGTAIAGALLLLAWGRRRTSAREVAPVH